MLGCVAKCFSFVLAVCFLSWPVSAFRRVCYFTNWSRDIKVAGTRFGLPDVEPHLCTHLLYAFAAMNASSAALEPIVTRIADRQEDEWQRYRDFNDIKRTNTQLQTLLSVGGSSQANHDFVTVVSSEQGRKGFAASAVTYLRTHGFDGLDVDWEYPGTPPETKQNFTFLLQALRAEFEEDARRRKMAPLLLSVAAPVSLFQMEAGYEIEKVTSLVDFINLMAYDFHGSWNTITSFNSPLYSRLNDLRFSPQLSVDWAVQEWLRRGAVAEKIVLGIAGYGQVFTLANASDHGVGAPTTGPGEAGRWRKMDGQMAFFEICEYIDTGGVAVWDEEQRVPYVYLGDQWVGYDDPRSIQEKVDYAVKHKLGGVMLWSIDLDDFRGAFCGQGRYPLLKAIVSAVGFHFPEVTVKIVDTRTLPHPLGTTTTTTTPTTTKTGTTTITTAATSSSSTLTRSSSPAHSTPSTSVSSNASTTATRGITTRRHTVIIQYKSPAVPLLDRVSLMYAGMLGCLCHLLLSE